MLTKGIVVFVSVVLFIVTTFIFGDNLAWSGTNPFQAEAGVAQGLGMTSSEHSSASVESLPGLRRKATVVRDIFGVPHITASSEHDVYFMMGYLQAKDRFFQMDFARRQGNGTLAEMIGPGPGDRAITEDVINRTLFGLGRSAERSLNAYSPEAMALIQAYSDGVNAWLKDGPLPPEYQLLEITRVPEWKPVDSLVILKLLQFQANFERTDLANTEALADMMAAGQANGFDGAKLFFEDLFRVSPFAPVATLPSPEEAGLLSFGASQSLQIQSQMLQNVGQMQEIITPDILNAAKKFMDLYNQHSLSKRGELGAGSNWWVVSGSKTTTGKAMLASDPHLGLGSPSALYEIHLTVDSGSSQMNVYGTSFAGMPGVFFGQNERISWGAANALLDITDFYAESLAVENGAPIGTRYKGEIEPLVIIPEEFKVNQVQNGVANDVITISPGVRPSGLNVPAASFVAPRRNNGAVVPGGPVGAISIQYTGASAARDLEGVFALARARNLNDFKQGLRLLDVGALNWAYADTHGNIATFTSGKVPLREDLRAGTVDGLPPFFIRDGTGALRNEWIPKSDGGPGFNFESVPFEEMPQAVNPAQGFLVNANNDPIGVTFDNNVINQLRPEGIYYISSGFDIGLRAAKITDLLNQHFDRRHGDGKVSFRDFKRIQSNVQLFDAEVLTPYIIRAFDAARSAGAPPALAALANDPAVSEAVGRLSNWDFSTPTGIPLGYDANDVNGFRLPPSSREVSNSIAATIYSVWRSRILSNTIVATLQRAGIEELQPGGDRLLVDLRFLLDNFATNHGIGSSGIDFFAIPGIVAPPEIRRDALILFSLKDALNLLAGGSFADAFGRSTDQNDYQWGKIHRIVFNHILALPEFSIPTAGGFEHLSPTLPGLATDGGFGTIDNAAHNPTGVSSRSFVFGGGPARRYIGVIGRHGIEGVEIIPGGESGVLDNRFFANQLSSWLTNDYHPVLVTPGEIDCKRFSKTVYRPTH